jgi:hypothetical protein
LQLPTLLHWLVAQKIALHTEIKYLGGGDAKEEDFF